MSAASPADSPWRKRASSGQDRRNLARARPAALLDVHPELRQLGVAQCRAANNGAQGLEGTGDGGHMPPHTAQVDRSGLAQRTAPAPNVAPRAVWQRPPRRRDEYSGSLSKRGGFVAKREIYSLNMHACRVGDGLHRRTRIAVSYEELCGNFGDMSAGPRSLFLSGVAKARAYALCAY
jgi:hypothetical protein